MYCTMFLQHAVEFEEDAFGRHAGDDGRTGLRERVLYSRVHALEGDEQAVVAARASEKNRPGDRTVVLAVGPGQFEERPCVVGEDRVTPWQMRAAGVQTRAKGGEQAARVAAVRAVAPHHKG